jgi:hypothetical protein
VTVALLGNVTSARYFCHSCKKKGHISHDCHANKSGDGGNAKGGTNKSSVDTAWKLVLLARANPTSVTVKKGGYKYRWCTKKFNNGKGTMFKYHHANTHGAWALCQKKCDSGSRVNKASLATTLEFDLDDFIIFGVLNVTLWLDGSVGVCVITSTLVLAVTVLFVCEGESFHN